MRCVALLATSQVEIKRIAVEVRLEMDFGGKPTPRESKRLILLPPFAPAAETWARTTVLSKKLHQMCGRTLLGQQLEKGPRKPRYG